MFCEIWFVFLSFFLSRVRFKEIVNQFMPSVKKNVYTDQSGNKIERKIRIFRIIAQEKDKHFKGYPSSYIEL